MNKPNPNMQQPRQVMNIVRGRPTRDGAGVQLDRVIPNSGLPMLDPFLLLDVFRSDDPNDYIAGFPTHPHRGFETVTYLLAGRVRHQDSAGHSGVVKAGGVQWMTAGSGIEHSEMPEQEQGMLEGFQLWVNLPAAQKMSPPRYRELNPEEIPVETEDQGIRQRVIAGRTAKGTVGPVKDVTAAPLYLDVSLPTGADYEELIPAGHNAFIYLIEGELDIFDPQGKATRLSARHLAVLNREGDRVIVRGARTSRFMLIAGRPIGEPVARHGPFVMNTAEEIEQAYKDYQDGLFSKPGSGRHALA